MHPKFLASAVAALFLAAGCGGLTQQADRRIDEAGDKVSTLVRDTGRTAPGVVVKSPPSVSHETGIWLGKDVVKVSQAQLPAVFYQEATFDKTVASLAELAERLSLRSGLPTRVTPDAMAVAEQGRAVSPTPPAASGAGALPGLPALPPGIPRPGVGGAVTTGQAGTAAPVRIYYANGNFKGLLDTAAARFGVSWKYAEGAILFYHTDSRTFQISTLPGDSTFTAQVASGATSTGGVNSSSGGGGGASNGVSSNNIQNTGVASRLSVYGSIESAVKAMLSAHGKVVISPATGSITVVDTPDTLERVASYIDNENKTLARQVMINVTVLSVNLSEDENYGIDWKLVYSTLQAKYGLSSALPHNTEANQLFAGIVGNSRFAGSNAIIEALSKQGKVRRQTTASVVTLNNQPVPVQVAKQTSYLQSSQTTVVAQVGTTTTLVPGTITSGFNMSILPHVLTNGTVLLQFSTDISSLRRIREVQSGNSKIESPEVDTRNFLQRVSLKSNETLIISGFEQTDDNVDRSGVGDARNPLLGGGIKSGTSKESIVILITPTTVGS